MNEDSGDEEGWAFPPRRREPIRPTRRTIPPRKRQSNTPRLPSNHSNALRSVLESLAGHMTPPQIVELAWWSGFGRCTIDHEARIFRSRRPTGQCGLLHDEKETASVGFQAELLDADGRDQARALYTIFCRWVRGCRRSVTGYEGHRHQRSAIRYPDGCRAHARRRRRRRWRAVARRLHVSGPSITAQVNLLVKANLVAKHPNPEDDGACTFG